MLSGFSIVNGSFIKQGRIYILDIVVKADTPFATYPQTVIGSIPTQYCPDVAINSFVGVAPTEWDNTNMAYMYLLSNIVVKPTVTGMSYAKISCTWAK